MISGIALIVSIFDLVPLPFDASWAAIILCGIPIILEAVIGLVTAFDIKADVLVSLALIASVCATILGTTAAFGIHCMKRRARTLIKNVNNMPLINPEIVIGISLLILFTLLKLRPGFLTLILAHITFCVPTVVLSVLPKLRQLNKNIYEAALDLGCSEGQAFYKVVIPEIMPGIVSGFLMALTYSIDDFVISYFTAGPTSQTLPLVIYTITRKPMTPKLNALSTIMFTVVLAVLILANIQKGDNKAKNKKYNERA